MNKNNKLSWPISGFPEFLPEQRSIEKSWIAIISHEFEKFGYVDIKTPAVEEIKTLLAKGEDSDKEIFCLNRINSSKDKESRFGLHFDLTVPFARYVVSHYAKLVFPFKRYQIQPVWRGERPQDGRYRQFTQCDIDVVNNGKVSLSYDAEVPTVALRALSKIGLKNIRLEINNAKLHKALCVALSISNHELLVRILDKSDKISQSDLFERLVSELDLTETDAKICMDFSKISGNYKECVEKLAILDLQHKLFEGGLQELQYVYERLYKRMPDDFRLTINLAIARGFDYYTGSVYEAFFEDYPSYPSICAGGRYDNLVGKELGRPMPGVGFSIGLTRIFTKMLSDGNIQEGNMTPSQVLVMVKDTNPILPTIADHLRSEGVNVEVWYDNDDLKKALTYADRKSIPNTIFYAQDMVIVKNMQTGEEVSKKIDMNSIKDVSLFHVVT